MENRIHGFSHLNKGAQKKKAVPVQNQRIQKPSNEQFIPDPYKKVAKGMEEQFANFMLEEMNKTTNEAEGQDSASQYYKSLMTGERAKAMAESSQGGLGLQKIILDQIYPQRLRNKIAYDNFNARENAQMNRNRIEMYRASERTNELDALSKAVKHDEGMSNE